MLESWLLLIIVFIGFGVVCALVIWIDRPWTEGKSIPAKPARVYKVAALELDGHFSGISGGGRYGLDTEAVGPGFYGFYDYDRAVNLLKSTSSRNPLIILEAVIYGDVSYYKDGVVGSRQKVLQVILPPCGGGCFNQGEVIYFDDFSEIVCRKHRYPGPSRNGSVISAFTLSKMLGDGVIVSGSFGAKKFSPTTDEELMKGSESYVFG